MTDYERGVEQASAIYKRVIREYVAENAKLRKLVLELYHELDAATQYDAGGGRGVVSEFAHCIHELGIEVDE